MTADLRDALPLGPRVALVVVDVQNDFADPRGTLFVPGGQEVAATCAALMVQAAAAGAPVICTQDWHPAVTPHFQEQGGPWPRHCVRGSWGAELHPLLPRPDHLVRKGQGELDGYSGFGSREADSGRVEATGLPGVLEGLGVLRLVLAGLALDVCVRETALDAVRLGYPTFLVRSATSPVELTPGAGQRALVELSAAGVEVV
ncbi:MAG: isochorismatase family protein [Candidatus Dormibacteria bacterium]